MPYPFTLPTTSASSLAAHYTSAEFPSLPLVATQHRGTMRNMLKAFKRQPPAQQATQLPQLFAALTDYLPQLLFLQARVLAGDARPSEPFTPAWRATLSRPPFPGARPKRVVAAGLDFEVAFVLSALAYTHTLLARSRLLDALSAAGDGDGDDGGGRKQQQLNAAIQHLLAAHAVFTHSLGLTRAPAPAAAARPADLSPPVLAALAALSLADATLLAVTMQDPYPDYTALAVGRSPRAGAGDGMEFLYTPPSAPTGVKALLLARICVAASTHAERALGVLVAPWSSPLSLPSLPSLSLPSSAAPASPPKPSSSSSRSPPSPSRPPLSSPAAVASPSAPATQQSGGAVVAELGRYLEQLQRVARAKACRFLAIDAEAAGRVGEAIGWIVLARSILSPASEPEPASAAPAAWRLKREFRERRESRAQARGDATWGLDAGRLEEARVLEALELAWHRSNDAVFFQPVVATAVLAARIPSGRDVHSPRPWPVPALDAAQCHALRGRLPGPDAAGIARATEGGYY